MSTERTEGTEGTSFWRKVGGRKNLAGYTAAALLTGMAFPLEAEYATYMTGILTALGLNLAATVTEDAVKKRSGP